MILRLLSITLLCGGAPQPAPGPSEPSVNRQSIAEAVRGCGLREHDVTSEQGRGELRLIVQPSAFELPSAAVICFVTWAQDHDVAIGFISEPASESR